MIGRALRASLGPLADLVCSFTGIESRTVFRFLIVIKHDGQRYS